MPPVTERPGGEAGPSSFSARNTTESNAARARAQRKPHAEALVYDEAGVRVVPVAGRVRWMLERLLEAGSRGFTTAEGPAGARVSDYVMKLRRAGISIEMERQPHGGAFPGSHGVYRLKSKVALRAPAEAGGRAA